MNYANGQGVPEDYVQSYAWMLLAKNGGDQKAKVNIEILAGEMTEDQISDAQLLVSKLRQQIENKDEPCEYGFKAHQKIITPMKNNANWWVTILLSV